MEPPLTFKECSGVRCSHIRGCCDCVALPPEQTHGVFQVIRTVQQACMCVNLTPTLRLLGTFQFTLCVCVHMRIHIYVLH